MVLHFASFVRRPTGAHALQARRICPVGRVRRKDTSYRHRGPGWKILGPYSDARGPGGGRAARTAARDPRKRPAAGPSPPNILATPTLAQPQKFSPSTSLLSGIVAHTRIRKVSCFYDGDGPPTAAKTSAHGLTHGLGGRQRRLHQHRARRHRAAPRSLGESRPALARPVDNRVRPLARGRPTGPCPIRWRRRAAPLCFCSWPLPHTRRGTNASLRSLASLSAADHAPPTPKISSQLRRS